MLLKYLQLICNGHYRTKKTLFSYASQSQVNRYIYIADFLYTRIDLKSITNILLKQPVPGTCNLHSSCRLIHQPFASAGRRSFFFNFQRVFFANLIKINVITVVREKNTHRTGVKEFQSLKWCLYSEFGWHFTSPNLTVTRMARWSL